MKKQVFRLDSDGFNGAWYPTLISFFVEHTAAFMIVKQQSFGTDLFEKIGI